MFLVGIVTLFSFVPEGLLKNLSTKIDQESTLEAWFCRVANLPRRSRVGLEIIANVQIEFQDGTSTSAFSRNAKTKPDGRFTISGLVPGHEYQLREIMKRNKDGFPASWRRVDTFKPINPKEYDIGEIGEKLPAPRLPR